jgi:hypothetical protein
LDQFRLVDKASDRYAQAEAEFQLGARSANPSEADIRELEAAVREFKGAAGAIHALATDMHGLADMHGPAGGHDPVVLDPVTNEVAALGGPDSTALLDPLTGEQGTPATFNPAEHGIPAAFNPAEHGIPASSEPSQGALTDDNFQQQAGIANEPSTFGYHGR